MNPMMFKTALTIATHFVLLFRSDPDADVLREQFRVAKEALQWDVSAVSKRVVKMSPDDWPISGHNGEWLGVLVGAWGTFLKNGDSHLAAEAEHLIATELSREAAAFRQCRLSKPSLENDRKLLRLAAILTHNVGDVDQGYSYWNSELQTSPEFARYGKLAHTAFDRFDGEFMYAKTVYKDLLSTEGHRNYPLREAKCLRVSPDLMLPIGIV